MILAGVDDAGRGSVLGPMVIAGVAIEESKLPQLVALGVKDSKLLTAKKRAFLYRKIKAIASVRVSFEKIAPEHIDNVVFRGEPLFRLNYLEAKFMARVLLKLWHFDQAYVDCCDTNQGRFGELIADLMLERHLELTKYAGGKSTRAGLPKTALTLGETNPLKEKICSEHFADRNYPVVSAASIIAKVTRDAAIRKLHKIHGLFGSGYPSDPATVGFLRSFIDRSEALPEITRLSWATIPKLYGISKDSDVEIAQQSMDQY